MIQCLTLFRRNQFCHAPLLSTEWLISLILIFLGGICISTAVILLFASRWDRNVIFYARWIGFIAMVVFCLAAVIFPLGFYVQEIGGMAYQLPNSHQVGIGYIFFILALWITVISELFAGKICLPHF
jgi:modulator of smoothened protein